MGSINRWMATLITLCGLSLVSTPASAGQLICKFDTLKKYDEKNALKALRRAVGALDVNGHESFYCRNPGRAIAWFTTERVQAADGAFDHVTANCSRGWMRWKCDVSKIRTIDFRFDSESQSGVVSIPEDMSPQIADSLFRKADKIAREQFTADRSCSKLKPDTYEYVLSIRDAYLSEGSIDGAEIVSEMERKTVGPNFVETGRRIVVVTRDLISVKFAPEIDVNGKEDLRFECWEVQIIVG